MGPMIGGFDKRKVVKLGALGLVALFTWSLIAAPSSIGQAVDVVEPETLTGYYTFADAAALETFVDHQALPLPGFGPWLAHSNSEVSLPSNASAIAWLLDNGILNGIQGTTTGNPVPTEVTAKQPGGAPSQEFVGGGGDIGEAEFARVAAGVARATAEHSDTPRSFAHAYFGNVYLFPAAGSPPEPPGSYDPDAGFPNQDPRATPTTDPAPKNQMAIVSIGSMASTSESIREGDIVTSIGVAELTGIQIGNRTSDNHCNNCFTIDSIRVETFARSAAQPGTSRAAYRVMLGRACRRTTEPTVAETITGVADPAEPVHEADQCLQPGNPTDGNYTLDGSTEQVVEFNNFFGKPILIPGTDALCGDVPCVVSIRITAGEPGHTDPARAQRGISPPEDPCRNYAYPNPDPKSTPIKACSDLVPSVKTGPDQDKGQEAKAVAEGIDVEITTLTGVQLLPKSQAADDLPAQIDRCLGAIDAAKDVVPQVDPQFDRVLGTLLVQVGCPFPSLRQLRSLNVTLGVAQANAVARPGVVFEEPPVNGGTTTGGEFPPIDLGPIGGTTTLGGTTTGGQAIQVIGGPGGKYGLKINWKSLKIKPWPAKDMAKATLAGAIALGMVLLIRRRLRFGAG